jgi:hypothetical protein
VPERHIRQVERYVDERRPGLVQRSADFKGLVEVTVPIPA